LDELVIDGSILLEWILGGYFVSCGLDSSGSGLGPVTDPFEYGNEISGSTLIIYMAFFE